MKKSGNSKVAPEVLIGIDLSNSINGGSSEIENWVESLDEGYEFTVKVPGVDIDRLSVEVIQDRIVVHYQFPVYRQDEDHDGSYARVVGDFRIPSDADYERVSASYIDKNRMLRVLIPFNEEQKGYRAKVEIER